MSTERQLEKNFEWRRKMTDQSPWLRLIGPDLDQIVLDHVKIVSVKRGSQIYGFLDSDQDMVGVYSGAIGIQIEDSDTGIMLAHVFGPGAWFGEAAVLTGLPRQIGVIALNDCELILLNALTVEKLAIKTPTIWRAIGMLSAINTKTALSTAGDLMVKDPEQRCIAVLRRLAQSTAQMDEIPVTQTQLSDMCQLSRSALSVFLKKFEQQGLLRVAYGKLEILASGVRNDGQS